MQIINVIELQSGIISTVNSFVILEDSVRREKDRDSKVQAAENLFIQKAEENGMPLGDKEYCLDQGHYYTNNYDLFLTWSE